MVAIAAGTAHSLALKADGTVAVWGANDFGQTNVPPGLSNVVAIACGGWHNLALKSDGTVVAWGAGIGSNTNVDFNQSTVPPGLTNVIQIATGLVNSLALVGNGPPVLQATLTNISFGTNGFSVFLPTRNGRVYRLEFNNSVSTGTWTGLPLQAGNGQLVRFMDPGASRSGQRFYRVRQW